MADKSLKNTATKSVMWTGLQKYSSILIHFISGIILARLLEPSDYGCIGMLTIFIAIAEILVDGGFGSALIQKKQPTQTDYSTIFWWNYIVATAMYLILFFSAPAIERFYHMEGQNLSTILRVEAILLFIYAFKVVQSNMLRKTFRFKIISVSSIVTSIISLTVTIILAYNGFGVWSLVAQHLISSLIPAIFFWFALKWRPMLVFSTKTIKELFGFGFYMFMSSLINTVCAKLSALLIGRLYSPALLGYYSKAKNTEMLASHSISSIMTQVTYPLYAHVQDNRERMATMVKRLTMVISLITFPLMGVLMLTAKPIFVLLYSEKWLESVPYFQIICLVGLSDCLQAVNTQTIAAIGKSRTMFQWTIIKRSVGLIFMIGGLLVFGIWGLLVGMVIYNWFTYGVNIGLVSKHIGYKWHKQLLDLVPVTVTVIVSALAAIAVTYFANMNVYVDGHLGLYLDGILKIVVFAIVFIGWIVMFKPEAFKQFLTIIPNKFDKYTHFLHRFVKQ